MDDEQGGTHTYTSPPCSENIENSCNRDPGIFPIDGILSDRDWNHNRNTVLDGMMDNDLGASMKESQRRKRVAEYLDKLMKERNIRIEDIDSTGWHQLVRDAENLVKNDERI